MSFIRIRTIGSLACLVILALNVKSNDTRGVDLDILNENVLKLQAKVVEQDSKIHQLQVKNTQLEEKLSEQVDLAKETFDCYRTSDWATEGVISFNGCSVDTTTGDPWTGAFTIREPGIYRFTFTGQLYYYAATGGGYVFIKVDGVSVAAGKIYGHTSDVFMLSLNTVQQLDVGQIVTVEWSGENGVDLDSDVNKYTHFTGQFLGSGNLTPPECEFTGQSFEYPGSCRKYYICLADGTIELNDCCPDVYDPTVEACVTEADGVYLCNDEDNCSTKMSYGEGQDFLLGELFDE